ncbi:MAG TPA: hypothetical protein VHZ30_01065, partial [Verrucomicrobiae bacterium]|nr:hypothetical protein [Verrucomicrobiae bacterium]
MNVSFDAHQFDGQRAKPVHADYVGGSEWESTGIDFNDYKRMSLQRRKVQHERRLPTPAWALDDSLLQSVLVRYLERRALLLRIGTGDYKQRLTRAREALTKQIKGKNICADRLCKRYVQLKNAQPLDQDAVRKLAQVIESLDTDLRLLSADCPGLILRVVYLYYRLGWNSTFIGAELHLKPPHVRCILWHLNEIADPNHTVNLKTWRKAPVLSKEDCERVIEDRLLGKTLKALSKELDIGETSIKVT